MSPTLPTLCGSMAAHPYRLAVELHNAAYRALGIDYTFVYFGITDPAAGVAAIRALSIRGMNVSMPFKAAVLDYLDRIDPAARAIGAVNTIDNRDGELIGYNTDYIGALRALEEQVDLAGARVALLGAGGAARAVAYGLVQRGARVTIFNRSLEKAARLAETFGLEAGGAPDQFPGDAAFDVLVNCTSIGFKSRQESPVEPAQLQRFAAGSSERVKPVVMDAVFLPPRTRLLTEAAAAGCRTIQGVRMLLHQACGQVELYTDLEAPLAVMEQVIEREIAGLKC